MEAHPLPLALGERPGLAPEAGRDADPTQVVEQAGAPPRHGDGGVEAAELVEDFGVLRQLHDTDGERHRFAAELAGLAFAVPPLVHLAKRALNIRSAAEPVGEPLPDLAMGEEHLV